MSLPSLDEALARMLAACASLEAETVPMDQADGRVLAEALAATRDQPPFDASSMDGWAVCQTDLIGDAVTLTSVGESVAGRRFVGAIETGEAVRIFTGAPLPPGADRVVIQERATVTHDRVSLTGWHDDPRFVRPRGGDFSAGEPLADAQTRLHPGTVALLAAAGHRSVSVTRRPRVAILATGNELARPDRIPTEDQIHDSVGPALVGLIHRWGGTATRLPIAVDDPEQVRTIVEGGVFDLLVTIGGASVGDHDVVKPALETSGLTLVVEGVNLRPGRPTWFGRWGDGRLTLGLPGNPVSALVCAEIFLEPLLAALSGTVPHSPWFPVTVAEPLAANGPREHLMRGRQVPAASGAPSVVVFGDQDSAWVSILALADVLVRRPPDDPARAAGETLEALRPTGSAVVSSRDRPATASGSRAP